MEVYKDLSNPASKEFENLLNNLYKNYLNRLRYFTHETGRNIMLSVSYSY